MPNVSKPNRKQLTPEEKTEIEEAFDLFDSDRDKLLDRDEFKVALKARLHFRHFPFTKVFTLLKHQIAWNLFLYDISSTYASTGSYYHKRKIHKDIQTTPRSTGQLGCKSSDIFGI